ncbi:hypothetical protein [Piscinibacter sp.]|uniref:hypothetical protein n=1 Tax=Piscinibacter sp. TaxID=1903157 RepID=UPI002C5CC739|nr:hypothetical protein [Albitalea sp.]HUG24179.1 hypothetical protein [Albitalea sp.]
MDRFTGSAVLSAFLLSLSLTACGGGSTSTAEAPATGDDDDPVAEAPADETVSGIATPSSVSVVTAKNAAQ